MAKTTAPLLSFDASGTVAKTQVYARWKGVPYVRRYATPSNPQTSEQTLTRNTFTFLNNVYKFAPPEVTAPWTAYIRGLPLTERNAFQKFNLPLLRPLTDLSDMVLSPGALGGLPPSAVVATPGNDELSIAITAPTSVPTGWTILEAVAAVILDQDPQAPTDFVVHAGTDQTSTYTIVITGLAAALQQVFAWFVWTRPDGRLAYSPSVQTSGTPT